MKTHTTEDRFSLNEAQMILTILLNHEILCVQIFFHQIMLPFQIFSHILKYTVLSHYRDMSKILNSSYHMKGSLAKQCGPGSD